MIKPLNYKRITRECLGQLDVQQMYNNHYNTPRDHGFVVWPILLDVLTRHVKRPPQSPHTRATGRPFVLVVLVVLSVPLLIFFLD